MLDQMENMLTKLRAQRSRRVRVGQVSQEEPEIGGGL